MNNQHEIEKVREVVQRYIDGTYEANISMLESVFHKEARMCGFLGEQMLIGTPEPFIEDMKSAPSMKENGDPFKAVIKSLNVLGNIAEAVVYETGFRGDGCLQDHLHLIKDGEWKIISKTFTTREPEA